MAYDFHFTADKLSQLLPSNTKCITWFDPLYKNLDAAGINTVKRVAGFIAQCAHESNDFLFLHENLNYRAESLIKTWPGRFNSGNAPLYEHQPVKIANRAYANRMGNGDEASGDGYKYRGRGPIQITGKDNYRALSLAMYGDTRLLTNPDAVELDKDTAVKSAIWFWNKNNLNDQADALDITGMTKKINGGTLGLEDRADRFTKALNILQG